MHVNINNFLQTQIIFKSLSISAFLYVYMSVCWLASK